MTIFARSIDSLKRFSEQTRLSVWIGIVWGVIYGGMAQAAARRPSLESLFFVTSIGFVFVLPLAMGVLTVAFASSRARDSYLFILLAPWATSFLSMLVAFLVGWEGTICLILTLPVYLGLSTVGGVAGAFIANRRAGHRLPLLLFVVLPAPFVTGAVETMLPLPLRYETVNTAITIEAPAEVVWQHVIRIKAIRESQTGFFYWLGFPKPIEATLSRQGVGGVREASFERGLLFLETVTEWEPLRKLRFKIDSDPRSTPTTTLDPHVVVGGRYFDVLHGEYRLAPRGNTKTVLHLTSEFRLSTRFNFYADLWARFLMRDIQENILRVIKHRCEGKVSP